MLKLKRYLLQYKKHLIIGPFFKWLEAVFELIIPLVMAQIIDVGIAAGDISYILKKGGIILALSFTGLCFSLICQYAASRASQGVGTLLRRDLYRHITRLSMPDIDRLGTSTLITRMTNDINQLQVAVAMLIRLVVRAPFLLIGAIVMAMIINVKTALIFIATALAVFAVMYLIMSRTVPYYRRNQSKLDKLSLLTAENLSGNRVVRAFSRQREEQDDFKEASEDYAESITAVGFISALLNPVTSALINLAIIAVIWFGGIQVNAGSLTQGEVIALINYMTQISLALVVVANLVVIFTKSAASAHRINELFETKPSVEDNNTNTHLIPVKGAPKISFVNAGITYEGNVAPSLSGLTIDIEKGETVGIIGGTGSGKTTIVNILARFYDATEGSVLIDGHPVKDYPVSQLRSKFGLVLQGTKLFHGSIKYNLTWGNPQADDNDVARAVEAAQASDFVYSKGLDDTVMQGGKNLSGGQNQRLAIARALIAKPEILVLDDSLSALDYRTDANLRKAIRGLDKSVTVIIVSQRANSIKYADKIIVMDKGKPVGIGKHEFLMRTCPVYKEIYDIQSGVTA